LLRAVRQDQSYTVTSHGKVIARVVPAEKHGGATRAAKAVLVRRLRSEHSTDIGHGTRDELYEEKQ